MPEPAHIAFLQPFGLCSPGGGSRILRAMLNDAPVTWTSICSAPSPPPKTKLGKEVQLPIRPSFGRMESSRLRFVPEWLEPLFGSRFRAALATKCRQIGATAIHAIPHGADFVHGWKVAQELGLKFILNVHDDVVESIRKRPDGALLLNDLGEIWRRADARFVISPQMGREYCARYGKRAYEIVTDGLERLSMPRGRIENRIHLYFMGLFHIRYEPNLAALLRALEIVRSTHPGVEVTATFRCGHIRESVLGKHTGVRVLPFGSEDEVEADLRGADLLYLPLPFATEETNFVRFSLSTKMITYLGSGIPILYHGPRDAAAFEVLSEGDAAFVSNSLEADSLAETISEFIDYPGAADSRVRYALDLARDRFMLDDQRKRFWNSIVRSMDVDRHVTPCIAG